MQLYRLPGLENAALHGWRAIGATDHRVPDLDAEAVARVWDRLEVAASRWRSFDLETRVEILAHLARSLRDRGPGAWRDILSRSTGLSPAGFDAAWDVTFAPYDADALWKALDAEGIGALGLEIRDDTLASSPAEHSRRPRAPRRIVHVLAGNVLPPTFAMLVRGWLLGAAQWLRPASREPLFGACIAAALPDLALPVADTLAVLWWPHAATRTAASVLSRAEVVTVQGDDAAVEAMRTLAAQHAPAAHFVGYGSRWSAVAVSRASQTPRVAAAVARDVALFDQQGCLSPSLVLAERGDALELWCENVAAAMRDLESALPRGTLDATARAGLRAWREAMRLRQGLGEVRALWESAHSTAWCVASMSKCRFEQVPLERHIVVVPFEDVAEIRGALADRLSKLQGLAIALDGWSDEKQEQLITLLSPTRVAPAGDLQLAPADWPQDHRPPFGSLLV